MISLFERLKMNLLPIYTDYFVNKISENIKVHGPFICMLVANICVIHSCSNFSSDASDLDLDAVASSTSLNISAAKHKIAIKPKTKARTSAYAQHRRAVSPVSGSSVVFSYI